MQIASQSLDLQRQIRSLRAHHAERHALRDLFMQHATYEVSERLASSEVIESITRCRNCLKLRLHDASWRSTAKDARSSELPLPMTTVISSHPAPPLGTAWLHIAHKHRSDLPRLHAEVIEDIDPRELEAALTGRRLVKSQRKVRCRSDILPVIRAPRLSLTVMLVVVASGQTHVAGARQGTSVDAALRNDRCRLVDAAPS